MSNELVLKKCVKCGAVINVMKGLEQDVICCGEKMIRINANCEDAVVEKHVPTYEVQDGVIKVKVNHVMEEEHFIEWVCLKTENKEEYFYFKPNTEAVCEFKNVSSGKLYAYCNKHGLWTAVIG